ncbi:MAG: hypothetical protein BGO52_03950 [Sphingobacteriales bacterium 44-61]|nr:MAG: hypothetical protein BGO52_03950 [Sphingobacteriales bacterium 44-61]
MFSYKGIASFIVLAMLVFGASITVNAQDEEEVPGEGSQQKMSICQYVHQGKVIGYGNTCVSGNSACESNPCD